MIEMYLNTKQITYLTGEIQRFFIKIWMLDGREITFPFGADRAKSPYDFVLRFINVWIFDPLEMRLLEIYVEEEYFESYEPVNGWFKKKEVSGKK